MDISWVNEWTWAHLLVLCYIVATIGCALRVLYRQTSTGTAFAWLIVLFVFPLFGIVLYLLLGEPRLGLNRQKRNQEIDAFYGEFAQTHFSQFIPAPSNIPPKYQGIERLAMSHSSFGATTGNAMTLLDTTDKIVNAMIEDIHAAKHSCLVSFYIIDPKGRIKTLLDALIQASLRGVHCVILADAMGSRSFFKSDWVAKLTHAGIEVHQSLPVGVVHTFLTRVDLRNHRKLLIIDKEIGYTGSFNLVDPDYFKQDAGVGAWVDVMMRCTGTIVLEMMAVFYADVAVEADQNLLTIKQRLTTLATAEHEDLPLLIKKSRHAGTITAQVIPSAPTQSEHVIYRTIIHALYSAKERITITTPYFVPDEPLLLALTSAAKRGVAVTLIVPAKVDSILVRYTSYAYFPLLLKSGIKIAQFYDGLLHTKTLVVDDGFCLFGTVNMDLRSFFLNLEISLAIYDAAVVADILTLQNDYLARSHYVSIKTWQERSRWWGLVENIARLFSPLL